MRTAEADPRLTRPDDFPHPRECGRESEWPGLLRLGSRKAVRSSLKRVCRAWPKSHRALWVEVPRGRAANACISSSTLAPRPWA